jgi:hypothetical protein
MRIIQVKEWTIVEQKVHGNKRPFFSVIIADGDISSKPFQVQVPYESVTDTTISPETHDLYIASDKLKPNAKKVSRDSIFFRERTAVEEGGPQNVSGFNNTPIGSTFGTRIGQKRKAIIEPSTGDNVTVGDGGCAIGAPGREVLAGKTGVTLMSGSPTIPSLPETDAIILKENGLGALAPRCFIPPFCFPRFLPNLQFLAQIVGVIGVLKAISEIQKVGK